VIDLRSDFLSSPTPAMLEAMRAAGSDPKGYGPRDDPHQGALERAGAEWLGKEQALFVPTCTMANLLAVMVVARRGDAVLLAQDSHVLNSESGALAAIAGVMTLPLRCERGRVPVDAIVRALRKGTLQAPATSMLLLENTHNKAGGVATGSAYFQEVRQSLGSVWMHLDGSRLPNASVATGEPAASLARYADSVSVSLNKALSAPAGALLAGPARFIEEATRLRQQLGGGWRPVGMLAAAALEGLRSMPARIAADHARARKLAETLALCASVAIDLSSVQTNIVRGSLDPRRMAPEVFRTRMRDHGVLLQVAEDGAFRLVTYPDIDDAAAEAACAALRAVLSPAGRPNQDKP